MHTVIFLKRGTSRSSTDGIRIVLLRFGSSHVFLLASFFLTSALDRARLHMFRHRIQADVIIPMEQLYHDPLDLHPGVIFR